MRIRDLRNLVIIFIFLFVFPPAALSESVSALTAATGITPENLTVAGWSTDATSSLLARIDADKTLPQEVADYAKVTDQLAQKIETLQQQLAVQPADQRKQTELHLLSAQLTDLNTIQHKYLRGRIWELATRGLKTDAVQQLRLIITAEQSGIPLPYRVYPFAEGQWEKFRVALAIQKQNKKFGTRIPDEITDLLDQINGDNRVIRANILITSNLKSLRRIFEPHD